MGQKPSVVEINGNRYDVVSGRLLKAAKKISSIDGFRLKPRPSPATKTTADHHRSPAQSSHTVHHSTQHSKTLMRSLVSRPVSAKREGHKEDSLRANSQMLNPARLAKAKSIVRNVSIKRFGNPPDRAFFKTTPNSREHHNQGMLSGNIMHSKPSTSMAVTAPMPGVIRGVSHQRLERMLDEALMRADAHKQALKGGLNMRSGFRRKIKRLMSLRIAILAFLLVVGLGAALAWKSIPQLSMKLASMKTHIKGSVPAYIPSGFRIAGPIKPAGDTINLIFRSNGDGRSFIIKQQASNWDSSSLEANTLAPGSQVQTSQIKGTTVYIYDAKNNATWVNNGVHYTILDNAQLSSEQILKIADSL